MSTELVVSEQKQYELAMAELDKTEGAIAAPKALEIDYFPRLQLFVDGSDEVKAGNIKAKHYAVMLDGNIMADIGEKFEGLVLFARPRAQLMVDGEMREVHFTENSAEFRAIKEKEDAEIAAKLHFSKLTAKTGREILLAVCVPGAECFATWFLGWNKSLKKTFQLYLSGWARPPIEPRQIQFDGRFTSNKDNTWYVPALRPSEAEVQLPSFADITVAVTKFRTEKSKVVEVTPEDEDR